MVKSSSSGAYCFVSGLSAKTQAAAAKSKYVLNIRQQPVKAKVCGQKERDRRPVDPPPIVQIKLADPSLDRNKDYLQSPYLFMCCNLVHASEPMGDIVAPAHRVLAGTVVSSLHRLKDVDNSDGGFFVFGDMSVRVEGHFCLRFTLFELIDGEVIQVMSMVSDPLTVYSSKNFPGMSESTFLSRCFSDQGVRIRIRKDHHVKPKRPLSADDGDAPSHAIHSPPLSSHEADLSASDYEGLPSKRSRHATGSMSGYAKPPHDRQLSLESDHRLPHSQDVMAVDHEHSPSRPLRDPHYHEARPGAEHSAWPHYPHYSPISRHGYADYPPPPPHHDPRYPYPPPAYGSSYYKYSYPTETHHHEHGGYEQERPPYSWAPHHEAGPSSGHPHPYLYYPHPHHPHSVYSHPYPPPPHHRYPYPPPIPEGRPHPSAGYPAASESPVMRERSKSMSQQRQQKHSITSTTCPSLAEHRHSIASSKHSRTPSMSSQPSEGAFSPPHPYSPPELQHAHRPPQKTTTPPMSLDRVAMLPPAAVHVSDSPSYKSLHGAPASPVSPTSSNESSSSSSSSSSSRPHLPSLSQSTSLASTSSSPADRIQLPPIHELSSPPKTSYVMEPGQIRDHFQERQAPYYYVNH
ncbi:hypothetical protein DFQ26_002884 [Actinomortierella ambigua]|nr:hypothetical protein DFQ26_002884 [Actinomortierella ambigua]